VFSQWEPGPSEPAWALGFTGYGDFRKGGRLEMSNIYDHYRQSQGKNDTGSYILICVIFLIFTYAVISNIQGSFVQSKCLVNGYPNYRVSWTLQGYCVKEVNETETVVPAGELE
jgi:hypothetical protein